MMFITRSKQNGAQLHSRESATLPTAKPLAHILKANRTVKHIWFFADTNANR